MDETAKADAKQVPATKVQALEMFAGRQPPAPPPNASTQALMQRESAEVMAAIQLAKRFPRDQVVAMDAILQACTRPGLAAAALYQYARGGQDVTGPSIRLAEAMAQAWGNLTCGVVELERRDGVSECLAYAWDLETNFRDEKRFAVRHLRDTKQGPRPARDERDIYEIIANMGARRKRACILAVIPGDVQEAAVRQCELTLAIKEQVTPERIEAMLAHFGSLGVTRAMLEARLQRRVEAITPALLVQLGKIANSLRDGMSAVADWFEVPPAPAPAAPPPRTLDDLASPSPSPTPPPTPSPPPTPPPSPSPSPEDTLAEDWRLFMERLDACINQDDVDALIEGSGDLRHRAAELDYELIAELQEALDAKVNALREAKAKAKAKAGKHPAKGADDGGLI